MCGVCGCGDSHADQTRHSHVFGLKPARMLQIEQDKAASARSESRREQIGGGGRSEKIRTYNFKENRLTDHRIGFTIYRLQDVLAGDLDEVVEALAADERAKQLAGGIWVYERGDSPAELRERLEGLNLGADDYITKPFFIEELIARYPLRGIKGPVGTAQDMLDLLDGKRSRATQLEFVRDKPIPFPPNSFPA